MESVNSRIDQNALPFNPSRVVLLSELSTRDKERYYTLLITHQAKFRRDSSQQSGQSTQAGDKQLFVADLRILAPGVKKNDYQRQFQNVDTGKLESFSWGREERIKRLLEDGYVEVQIVGVEPFEYNTYTKFAALISNHGDTVRPKGRTLSWVMKTIEDIYDARFAQEKLDVEREDDQFSIPSESNSMITSIFPFFSIKHLATVVGMSKILDSTCWDLIYNIHHYRREYIEVEAFARFLQEFYNHDDLLFYLYVRNVVGNLLHVNFKHRWAKSDGPGRLPKTLWMSYRECVYVAKTVFGANNEALYRDFLNIIIPQMVGQKTATVDSRRIDIAQYLHLAVVGYHQTQDGGSNPQGGMTEKAPITDSNYDFETEEKMLEEEYEQLSMNRMQEDINPTPMNDFLDPADNSSKNKKRSSTLDMNRNLQSTVDGLLTDEYQSNFDRILSEVVKETQDSNDGLKDDYGKWTLESLAGNNYDEGSPAFDAFGDSRKAEGKSSKSNAKSLEQHVSHKTSNATAQPDAAAESGESDGDDEEDEFAALQVAREKEFMAYIGEPLTALPEDVAEYIVNDIAIALRQHVNEALDKFPQDDELDSFDSHLLQILQEESLRSKLETMREDLLKQLIDSQSPLPTSP